MNPTTTTFKRKATRSPAPRSAHSAFTLIEMLVVVAILIVLIAILIPVLGRARESAKGSATRSTINAIGQALESYKTDLGSYPTVVAQDFVSVPRYGYCVMARGLVGFEDAAGDGADGFGFRINRFNNAAGVNAVGPVHGPYLMPSGRNYKVFNSIAAFPNGAVLPANSAEISNSNQGFVDAWGQPIFYFPSRSGGDLAVFTYCTNNGNSAGNSVFFGTNPDVAAPACSIPGPPVANLFAAPTQVSYTVNGSTVNSRLVPYTPVGKWKTGTVNGTPWGVAFHPSGSEAPSPGSGVIADYRYPQTAGYTAPNLFRKLIGQSDPLVVQSVAIQSGDIIVGRNSFLLVSAGSDNQYYTGDEIINEWAK